MSDKVRLAVVGVGWWGGVLADGVAAGDDAELVACFARTPEAREKFASERGVRAASSYEELLADDQVEGVLLATSHVSHADLIEQAAAAGKHVFVEKPFTLTVEDGKRGDRRCGEGRNRAPGRSQQAPPACEPSTEAADRFR